MKTRYVILVLAAAAMALPGCKPKEEAAPPSSGGPPVPSPMGPGPMPGMGRAQMVALGKDIFAKNCAGCHGARGQGARKDAPNFASPAWQKETTDAEIAEQIKNGTPGKMPAFGNKLPEHDRAAAAAFVRSLAGPTPGGPPMPGPPM